MKAHDMKLTESKHCKAVNKTPRSLAFALGCGRGRQQLVWEHRCPCPPELGEAIFMYIYIYTYLYTYVYTYLFIYLLYIYVYA